MFKRFLCFNLLFFNAFLWAQPLHFSLQGLENERSVHISERDFPDKYLLLTLGYMSCPDICPTTLYDLGQLMKKTSFKEKNRLQPIFISIDPQRDSIHALARFTQFFDPHLMGVTGEFSDIQALATQLNASFGYRAAGKPVQPPNLPAHYEVYHSTYFYLVSPEREIIDVYAYDTSADKLAANIDQAIADNEK